jgi:hypothetical protein
MKSSKFYTPPSIQQRLDSIKYAILFWKGRSKGVIHTRDLKWHDLRYIFFPKGFEEKYGYLGTSVYERSRYFKAIYPLVLAMDYEAKPKLCPRWFLRFLHVFGNDKSIVRVRNRRLSNLHHKLTKNIAFWDYKTKWSDYDLRISIVGPKHLQDLADDIETGFYNRGYREYLEDELKRLDPEAKPAWSIEKLRQQIEELEEKLEQNENNTIR